MGEGHCYGQDVRDERHAGNVLLEADGQVGRKGPIQSLRPNGRRRLSRRILQGTIRPGDVRTHVKDSAGLELIISIPNLRVAQMTPRHDWRLRAVTLS
jgi:hypothetical protein